MKNILLLFFLVILFKSNAQSKDTVFLKREVKDTPYLSYHAIFIDSSLKVRKSIMDFKFGGFDSVTYFDGLTRLLPLKRFKLPNDFPKKWIRLYLYKGKYYLYKPSEIGLNYKFEITDSTTKDFTMEGPEASRIDKFLSLSTNHIKISRTNYWKDLTVEINIIDKEKGIAVFKFSPPKNDKEHKQILMLDITKAYLFPLIYNYSPYQKQFKEFEFDEIDFNKLLKRN